MDNASRWNPDTYLNFVRTEIPQYEQLQQELVEASTHDDHNHIRILDLGSGTGETARRVLSVYPQADLLGIDASSEMLVAARNALKNQNRVHFRIGQLEEQLPSGPFDLVTSALTVHHLNGDEKQDLFKRVREVLRPGGRFVLADVVTPENTADAQIELSEYDFPDAVVDQLDWLRDAGLEPHLCWSEKDLAVIAADAPSSR